MAARCFVPFCGYDSGSVPRTRKSDTHMALTFFDIKSVAPKEKPFKLSDGDGLYLVLPNGHKFWRFRYRFAGIEKMLALGPFPAVSLAEARIKRDAARQSLIEGVDPSVQKKLDRIAAETAARNTFGLIAEEFRPYVAPAIALDVRSRLGHVPYMFTVRGGFHGSALPFVRRGPLAQSGQGDADVRPGRRKRVPAPALARDGRQAGLPELRLPGLL